MTAPDIANKTARITVKFQVSRREILFSRREKYFSRRENFKSRREICRIKAEFGYVSKAKATATRRHFAQKDKSLHVSFIGLTQDEAEKS